MSTVKLEPHAALPAERKVAAAGRDAGQELNRLQHRAMLWRLALLVRGIIDPAETGSSAAEWKKWALDGFDAAQHAGTEDNRQRFRDTTASVMEDCRDQVLALSPQMQAFIRGAGIALARMTAFDDAFIQGALATRAQVAAYADLATRTRSTPTPRSPDPEPPFRVYMHRAPANAPRPGAPPFDRARLAVQMPWVIRPGTPPKRNPT